MGYDCPCGASVGTRAHWCEWKQERHADRLEAAARLAVLAVLATTDQELRAVREGVAELEAEAEEAFR